METRGRASSPSEPFLPSMRLARSARPTIATHVLQKEGNLEICRSVGSPPARQLESGKQVKHPMFSVISPPVARLEAAPPEVTRRLFRRFRTTSGGAASCRALADGPREGNKKTTQTIRDNSFKGPGRTTPPDGREANGMREENGRAAGGKREEGGCTAASKAAVRSRMDWRGRKLH